MPPALLLLAWQEDADLRWRILAVGLDGVDEEAVAVRPGFAGLKGGVLAAGRLPARRQDQSEENAEAEMERATIHLVLPVSQ
jgi:hypothetical protein